MVLSMFITEDDISSENEELGFVYDIDESSRGYVFNFQKTDGTSIRCFYQKEPENAAYSIKGDFSEDGSMFFVKSMKLIPSE